MKTIKSFDEFNEGFLGKIGKFFSKKEYDKTLEYVIGNLDGDCTKENVSKAMKDMVFSKITKKALSEDSKLMKSLVEEIYKDCKKKCDKENELNENIFTGPKKHNEHINTYYDDIANGKFQKVDELNKLIDTYIKKAPRVGARRENDAVEKAISGLRNVLKQKSKENLPENLKVQIARVEYCFPDIIKDKNGLYITGKVESHGTGGASNASW